ncbi:hypothetical protein PAPYR_10445 [Paratrimastix pyriformis]|uniref:Uncharacterized protein n=1 Tax=Paratrimastix pyriformis TaxID=342808 RepID=A0ABQ8U9Q5_9EUKA|nr:hypothetical protein PAPYR_10445 [Paratrimastix pyriformis]
MMELNIAVLWNKRNRYCNSLGSQHDISAAADADSMPVKLHQKRLHTPECVQQQQQPQQGVLPIPSPGDQPPPPRPRVALPGPPPTSPRAPWSHRPGAITAPTIVYPRPDTPAPADPQQERLKNRVIAAFQMQQLVEELAQREQAASDAAARCRDLEAASRSWPPTSRSGGPWIGCVRGPHRDPAGRHRGRLAKVAHSDAALTIKRPVSTPRRSTSMPSRTCNAVLSLTPIQRAPPVHLHLPPLPSVPSPPSIHSHPSTASHPSTSHLSTAPPIHPPPLPISHLTAGQFFG